MPRDRRRWSTSPTALIWLGLLLIALAVSGYALRLRARASDLEARATALAAMMQTGAQVDLLQARTHVKAMRFDLSELRADLAWTMPVLPALQWVPEWGSDAAQGESLLNAALDLVAAADEMLDGVAAVADGDPGVPILERSLEPLAQNEARFARARAHLARAAQSRTNLNERTLSPRTAAYVRRMDRLLPLAQFAADGASTAPELLGASTPKRYLIVAQNEDELRATGGFVSAAGLLSIDRGRVLELSFMDSYQVDDPEKDYPKPPDALERIMRAGMLLFRDANWSPDFPTSAQLLAELYEAGQGTEVDGVIALDQEAVSLLVEPVMPLQVPQNPPVVVTPDNLIGYMRDSWAPPPGRNINAAWLTRKGFIGDLAQAYALRLMGDGQTDAGALGKNAYKALQERHISVWLKDSALRTSLARTGWDGSIRSGDGDFVMVVDSNVGFNKANALVTARYRMEMTVAPDLTTRSTLSVTYRHGGTPTPEPCVQFVPDYGVALTYQALTDMCYWDYLRVLVPKGTALRAASRYPIPGSQLLGREDSSGEPEVLNHEPTADAFAIFFNVERGGAREVSFTYDPPPGTIVPLTDGSWQYRLRWQKQAGTPAAPLELSVVLPPGAVITNVETSVPAEIRREAKGELARADIAVQLATDLEATITFRRR